jgi:NAD dependent epimerase/dehydratase family enzyme
MAQETILASSPVYPAKLLAHGYRHRLPDLDEALGHELAASLEPA